MNSRIASKEDVRVAKKMQPCMPWHIKVMRMHVMQKVQQFAPRTRPGRSHKYADV